MAHTTERRLIGGDRGHEHTLVDHRSGGPTVEFSAGPAAWVALAFLPVKQHRALEAVGAVESHVASAIARTGAPAAAVLRASNDRHAAALIWLPSGHHSFEALRRDWDLDGSLALTLVTATRGFAAFDPRSHAILALESLTVSPTRAEAILAVAEVSRGFIGAAVLAGQDEAHAYLFYRFDLRSDLEDFRTQVAVREALGPAALTKYHVMKTYGPS